VNIFSVLTKNHTKTLSASPSKAVSFRMPSVWRGFYVRWASLVFRLLQVLTDFLKLALNSSTAKFQSPQSSHTSSVLADNVKYGNILTKVTHDSPRSLACGQCRNAYFAQLRTKREQAPPINVSSPRTQQLNGSQRFEASMDYPSGNRLALARRVLTQVMT
jgi:hypothetical protein